MEYQDLIRILQEYHCEGHIKVKGAECSALL